jgi:hypothetical protein
MTAGGSSEPPRPAELQPGAPPPTTRPPGDGSFWADWQSLLRNRLILGGLSLLIVLLITTLVLVFVGSGGNSSNDTTGVEVGTPAKTSTPFPAGTVIGRMRTTASVLAGPNAQYTPLGTIRSGVVLQVIGRSEDGAWLQVIYPPGTALHGWVDRALLDVTGNVSVLRIAGPEAGPNVEVPTSLYVNPTYEVATDEIPTFDGSVLTSTPRPTRTRAPTATPIRVRTVPPDTPTVAPQ